MSALRDSGQELNSIHFDEIKKYKNLVIIIYLSLWKTAIRLVPQICRTQSSMSDQLEDTIVIYIRIF